MVMVHVPHVREPPLVFPRLPKIEFNDAERERRRQQEEKKMRKEEEERIRKEEEEQKRKEEAERKRKLKEEMEKQNSLQLKCELASKLAKIRQKMREGVEQIGERERAEKDAIKHSRTQKKEALEKAKEENIRMMEGLKLEMREKEANLKAEIEYKQNQLNERRQWMQSMEEYLEVLGTLGELARRGDEWAAEMHFALKCSIKKWHGIASRFDAQRAAGMVAENLQAEMDSAKEEVDALAEAIGDALNQSMGQDEAGTSTGAFNRYAAQANATFGGSN